MENLFFFWGQEDFLINSEIEKIKSKNIDKNFETMAYKKLYEPSFDEVINAIQTLPMMFGNVMHVIDATKIFVPERESEIEDWQLKQFETALQNKSEKNIVVLKCIIPLDSKRKVDTRKKIYKITAKYAQEKQFPLFREYDTNLQKVISDMGKKYGLKLNPEVIKEVILQIGTYLGTINSELQKLSITIYPETTPKIEDIHNICTQKDDVFIILGKIFNGETGTALFELKKVLEKISVQEVFGAVQHSLRNFVIIKKYYPKIGKSGLYQKLHLPEFIIEKNYNAMSKISGAELLKLKKNILKAEYMMKTGDCVNPETALEMALMGVNNV